MTTAWLAKDMHEIQTTGFAMLGLVVGAESVDNNPSPTVIDTRKTGGENLKAIDAIAVHHDLDWLYAISREGGIHCLGATTGASRSIHGRK